MKELKITAEDKNMDRVNDFIHSCLPSECPPIIMNKIDLAVEEIFVNIASYAYDREPGLAVVCVDTSPDPASITITFMDRGIPYNPLANPDPDISLPLRDRKRGGLGIFVAKQYMDDIAYQYKDGQNILTLKKRL